MMKAFKDFLLLIYIFFIIQANSIYIKEKLLITIIRIMICNFNRIKTYIYKLNYKRNK